jgi:predicted metal-dependent hydrolase
VTFRELLESPDFPAPVVLQPMRNARRLRLRFDDRSRTVKLTYPHRMSKRTALSWAAGQTAWIEAQLRSALPAEPFVPGAVIPLDGEEVQLCWSSSAPRAPELASDTLISGGPIESFPARIERFLKRRALDLLSLETADIAAIAGATLASVSVGDARSRWGSCSSSKRIRYSWRLVFAPAEARRFVVAHEVAHLVHLNHGPAFKALERELFSGDVESARRLLRRIGPRLRRLGRVA